MNSSSVPKTNEDNHQHHQNQPHHHYDVFFARGHGVDKNPGNKIYRSMIRTHHHAYKTYKNNENMQNEIVRSVIQPIISAGGKFYSQTKGAGSTTTTTTNKNNTGKRNQELSHPELIKKVKQSLRDCKEPTDATSSSKSSNEMTTSSSIRIADATSSSSDAMILNRNHEQTKKMVISPLQHQDVPKEDISSYGVSIHAYHTTDNQARTDMPNNHHHHHQQQQPQNNYEPLPHTTSGSMIYEQEDSTMMTNMIKDDTTQTSSQQTLMNCSVGSFFVPDLLTSVSNIWGKEDDSRIFLGESFQFNNESVTRMGSNTSSSLIDDLKDILMDE